ncbi:MAG: Oligopeptide transport ATP-binding protein OppD [Chlamydiia bacterium]|nr:Oligopeptide transport ATP-binding protein OppD [Chlamydiia bacterium]
MNGLLKVKNLHLRLKTNQGIVHALRGVSINLHANETLAIVGESGSGKSLTMRALLQLVPEQAISSIDGTVIYDRQNLLSLSENKIRSIRGKEIGMIFQDPFATLDPTQRIGYQIIEGILIHFPYKTKAEAKSEALSLLELVGIENPLKRYDQYPHEFSGGMLQRIIIAMVLAMKPKILIADEPTTALDVTIQKQILALLKSIRHKLKMSIIFITHDLSLVHDFCDRICVMYAGKIIEMSERNELFTAPKHPYTVKLLQSIPHLNLDRKSPLEVIEGTPPSIHDEVTGCPFFQRCPKAMTICRGLAPPAYSINGQHKCACWLYDKRVVESTQEAKHASATP